jgi:uncharacterized membrane protein
MEHISMIDRWLHIVSGVMWIGLLYYFNFVQVPAMAAAAADKEGPGPAAIAKYVAPRALFWFRYAALATWLTGAYYLAAGPYTLHGAFTLGLGLASPSASMTYIGFGAWLGTIMLVNVWGLIWPNQKKILGIVQATDEEKGRARRVAFLASRTNTMLSIPMLMFMQAGSHGLPFFG